MEHKEDDMLTSGFVEEKTFAGTSTFAELHEIYSSPSGYNRLFRCERYGRLHVLKTLQALYAGSSFHEQVLRKEFNIGYQLDHPHICHTLGWEQVPGLGYCILLEYVDGITLKEFMEQGKLTPLLARKFITELCSALQYLHSKQIIHRDLKPTNILITYNGNNVKLIDFGLSDRDDYDVLKMPAGTRYYLAPETLQADVSLDLRADIYSLGVVIGEMATLLKDKRLAAISRKCTQRKREKRYASAEEIVAALEGNRSSVRRYVVAAAVALVVIAGGVAGYWQSVREKEPLVSLPVYGNVSVSDACRRILADERIRLNRLQKEDNRGGQPLTAEEDIVRLLARLKAALDDEYPLPVQQQSEAYRRQWELLRQEVKGLFHVNPLPQSP